MIYFLTSNPLVLGKLNDANSFTEKLRGVLPSVIKLLFVCSDPDNHEKTLKYGEDMKMCFENSGFKISDFNILDGANREDAAKLAADSDCIVLAGGHVPTQNKFFNEISLAQIICPKNDKVIIGFSAGSMNCASEVYAQPGLEGETRSETYTRFLKGLGITETNVLPHFGYIRDLSLDGLRLIEDIALKDSMGRKFWGINDGSYILGDGRGETIYGEAYLISDGTLKKVSSDEGNYKIF